MNIKNIGHYRGGQQLISKYTSRDDSIICIKIYINQVKTVEKIKYKDPFGYFTISSIQ